MLIFKHFDIRSLCLVLPIFASQYGAAAEPLPDLEEHVHISLSAEVTSHSFRLNYPGMGGQVLEGELLGGFESPDCLVVNGRGLRGNPAVQEKVANLVSQIEVRDGPGILFNRLDVSVLEPQLINGTHVFFLQDLGAYVTGVEVKTKDPQVTLKQLMSSIFGDQDHNLRLTFSRGCALLGR